MRFDGRSGNVCDAIGHEIDVPLIDPPSGAAVVDHLRDR
jgi:hypothetical protein